MLAALLQRAPGAPAQDALTYSQAGDTSGEEEEEVPPEPLRDVWDSVLGVSSRHQKQVSRGISPNYVFVCVFCLFVFVFAVASFKSFFEVRVGRLASHYLLHSWPPSFVSDHFLSISLKMNSTTNWNMIFWTTTKSPRFRRGARHPTSARWCAASSVALLALIREQTDGVHLTVIVFSLYRRLVSTGWWRACLLSQLYSSMFRRSTPAARSPLI